MTTKHENLEERLERIRLVNKELEKKHRLAEEDRRDAEKIGALVTIKNAIKDDWPIQHKYDNEDYERNEDEEEDGPSEVRKPIISRTGREIIPPADPLYNFLADETRDGKKKTIVSPPPVKMQDLNKKPRNQNREKNSGNLQRSKSQNEGNWRNKERRNFQPEMHEKIQQQQFNRQKSLNESHDQDYQDFVPPNQQLRGQEFVDRPGNISVSVSRDGEVKSVRLTSAPVIGSGRVAHSRQPNVKPQFVLNMNQDQGIANQNQGFHKNFQNQNQEKKFHPRKIQKSHAPPVQTPLNDNILKKASVQDRLMRTRHENNETAQ